jgi:hypothetical protein
MSIKKRTKVAYPHIVKEYNSIEQFISENEYDSYYEAVRSEISAAGIDLSNEAEYKEALSEDSFEVIATVVFPDEATWNAYVASCEQHPGLRKPIFEENIEDHII